MSGFVGVRARKRRRNIFLTLGFLIIVASIYFIFPTFQFNMNDPVPDENLIPDPTEDLTSLASDIEDLELIVFQKDQKIKFRDGQINNLKIQLQDNKAQLENTIKELDNIKGLYAAIISSNDNSVPLDDLNILYSGSKSEACKNTWNKKFTKEILDRNKIKTPVSLDIIFNKQIVSNGLQVSSFDRFRPFDYIFLVDSSVI